MTNFNKKLNEAVKSVFKDMAALSSEELKKEVRSYISDKMSLALHYAIDYKNVSYGVPKDPQFSWEKMQSAVAINRFKIPTSPSLFANEPIKMNQEGRQGYARKLTSDDYLLFRAAA